jgi:hypothetical protein
MARGRERSYEQAAAMQAKAVRFLRDVVGDEAKAAEIEGLSVDGYADRRKLVLTNPARRRKQSASARLDRIIARLLKR